MTTDETGPAGRRWHDMGGDLAALRRAAGGDAIDPASHDFALWEKRVDALVILASRKGVFTVDGLRRALEDMGPEAFERFGYYERWVAALAQNLIEAGVVTVEEIRAKTEAVRARGESYGAASIDGAAAGGGR